MIQSASKKCFKKTFFRVPSARMLEVMQSGTGPWWKKISGRSLQVHLISTTLTQVMWVPYKDSTSTFYIGVSDVSRCDIIWTMNSEVIDRFIPEILLSKQIKK